MTEFPQYLTKGGERDAPYAIATDAKHEAELVKQGYARIGAKQGQRAKRGQRAD